MADVIEVAGSEAPTAALAAELLAKIAQARSDSSDDPFGNPVLRVTLWLTRRMDRGVMTHRGRPRPRAPSRPGGAAAAGRAGRALCRAGRRWRAALRGTGGAAGGRGRCGCRSLRELPAFRRAGALRRRLHRPSDLRDAAAAGACAGRSGLGRRGRAGRAGGGRSLVPARWPDHAAGRVRAGALRRAPCARRGRPAERGAARGREAALAGALGGTRAAFHHPCVMGRLRHGRTHRYRLVGHAALPAGIQARPVHAHSGEAAGGRGDGAACAGW